jgi:hypothetical protein
MSLSSSRKGIRTCAPSLSWLCTSCFVLRRTRQNTSETHTSTIAGSPGRNARATGEITSARLSLNAGGKQSSIRASSGPKAVVMEAAAQVPRVSFSARRIRQRGRHRLSASFISLLSRTEGSSDLGARESRAEAVIRSRTDM